MPRASLIDPPPTACADWLPSSEPDRFRFVGRFIYGKHYIRRLADGLGLARTTLWQLMRGRGKRITDLDNRLIELLDAESEAAAERGLQLDNLRKRFLKERRHDAAA